MADAPLGPLRFRPILRPLVWGGRRLQTVLGRSLPDGEDIGESWEIVDLPEAVSQVDGGPADGMRLDALVRERRDELLGSTATVAGGFPLLIKLLDAHRMLSVQVHPGEAQARSAGGRPKTEAWFILHTEPDAQLLIGLKRGVGPDDVRRALSGGDGPELPELLVSQTARPGDVHLIEAGTVHCLGAGVVLAEVQQPSDTTYRLFDWGRGRPVHVEEALASIAWDRPAPEPLAGAVDCAAFSARWIRGGGDEPAEDRCRVLIATSPGGLSAGGELQAGDTVLLPASCPDLKVTHADYIRVTPP